MRPVRWLRTGRYDTNDWLSLQNFTLRVWATNGRQPTILRLCLAVTEQQGFSWDVPYTKNPDTSFLLQYIFLLTIDTILVGTSDWKEYLLVGIKNVCPLSLGNSLLANRVLIASATEILISSLVSIILLKKCKPLTFCIWYFYVQIIKKSNISNFSILFNPTFLVEQNSFVRKICTLKAINWVFASWNCSPKNQIVKNNFYIWILLLWIIYYLKITPVNLNVIYLFTIINLCFYKFITGIFIGVVMLLHILTVFYEYLITSKKWGKTNSFKYFSCPKYMRKLFTC